MPDGLTAGPRGNCLRLREPSPELRSESPLGDRLTLTINETAPVLSIHRDSVYKLLHSGELVASKVAGRTVVHVASIQRLLGNSVFKPGPRYRGHADNALRITCGRDAQAEVSVPDTKQ